ncbi:MAG: hypothetical protein WC222_00040 [Parachlamydiales bacterium]|jgi:hypothetical protein
MNQEERPPFNPYGDQPHPFEKVYSLIEELLNKIEENKTKPLTEVPEWIFEELDRVQKEVQRFSDIAEKTSPITDLDVNQFRKLMRKLPLEDRTIELELVEKAQKLKLRTQLVQRDLHLAAQAEIPKNINADINASDKSPMSLLNKEESTKEEKKEDAKNLQEYKKKFGRVGGKKNWRPL